jgi:hypothetical protein
VPAALHGGCLRHCRALLLLLLRCYRWWGLLQVQRYWLLLLLLVWAWVPASGGTAAEHGAQHAVEHGELSKGSMGKMSISMNNCANTEKQRCCHAAGADVLPAAAAGLTACMAVTAAVRGTRSQQENNSRHQRTPRHLTT